MREDNKKILLSESFDRTELIILMSYTNFSQNLNKNLVANFCPLMHIKNIVDNFCFCSVKWEINLYMPTMLTNLEKTKIQYSKIETFFIYIPIEFKSFYLFVA